VSDKQYILAVDPGWTGACAIVSTDLKDVTTMKSHPSPQKFLEVIQGKEIVEAWEEEVGGMPGDTPHTAFKLGASYGIWQSLLSCVAPEVLYVLPKPWQTRFARMMTDGKVRYCPKDRKERKEFIHQHVRRVYSGCYLYAADAVAIAIYAAHTYGQDRKEFRRHG